MSDQGCSAIWPVGRTLIGMVHLPPLPGSPGWAGSMDAVLEQAEKDAVALSNAGFDGVVVENYGDVPFFRGPVPPETVAGITAAVTAVRQATPLPVGVNVLRNDARAALGIAAATGARFVRINVHTGSMWTDQGLIEGEAADTLRARTALGSEIAILADVHVKHGTPPAGSRIEDAALDAWHRGLASALIVSGSGTGHETDVADLERVRTAVPNATVLVGSGTTRRTIREILALIDGAIVGSAVMVDGRAGAGVDPARAGDFVRAARG